MSLCFALLELLGLAEKWATIRPARGLGVSYIFLAICQQVGF
ncbi:uncharacterized protein G2W53_039502 [Senna tora]|uniref:Uncharacterized protein n=1 Tax=Senna tora TaxID=362788 RepID=A0A834SQ38_9FABA|nr:uncharacterized protein G2W53_039502 [Senna tora]